VKIARLVRLEGLVQGVCFRDWAVETARGFAVTGWIRNRRDGSVEALVVGEATAVERFVACLRQGPPASRVDRVSVAEAPVEQLAGFARAATA